MSVTEKIQPLVDQMVRDMDLEGLSPSSIEIHMDNAGKVQTVTPRITFRRAHETKVDKRNG